MRRVLVTGAGGFIGKHLVSALQLQNFHVHTLQFRLNAINNTLRFHLDNDAVSNDDLPTIINHCRPEILFHLAGSRDKETLFDVNIGFTFRLIHALRQSGLSCKIILAGSAAEFGPIRENEIPVSEDMVCKPDTDYGISKLAQTLLGVNASTEKNPVVVARLFNVAGHGMPRHLPLADIACRLSQSQVSGKLVVGNLDIERDFADVRDVARTLIELADSAAAAGQIVNICSGKGIWLRSVVEQMVQIVPWQIELITDESLSKLSTVNRIIGSNAKLSKLGCRVPDIDFHSIIRGLVMEALIK